MKKFKDIAQMILACVIILTIFIGGLLLMHDCINGNEKACDAIDAIESLDY